MFLIFNNIRVALKWSSLCFLLLIDCAVVWAQDEPERRAVPATELPNTLPAPVSVTVKPSLPEPAPAPMTRIKERLREIGTDESLVVQARVTELVASERILPEMLHWGKVPHIVTTLTLEMSETFCGTPLKELRAFYIGGRLPDGRVQRTELMPKDLAVGDEQIFFLRKLEEEYFLELGREDMLRQDPQGDFRDASGNRVALYKLRGVCS